MILDESLFEADSNKRPYRSKNFRLKNKLTFDKVCDDLLAGVGQGKTKYTVKGNIDPKYTIKIKNTLSNEKNPETGRAKWAEQFIKDSEQLSDAKEYFDEKGLETKQVFNGGEQAYSLLVAMPEEMFVEAYRPHINQITPEYIDKLARKYDDMFKRKDEKDVKEDLTQDMLQDLKDQDVQYELDKEAEREAKVELAKQGIVKESVSKDKLKELADKYGLTVKVLDDEGNSFWIEGNEEKRDDFFKEYIELSKTLDEDIVKSIEKLDPEVQREVDFVFASDDQGFGYKMLDRLRSDNDYVLGALSGNSEDKKLPLETINKFLWFHDIDKQIDFMKGIYERLDEKPEWISEEQIEEYRGKLKDLIRSNEIKENLESFDYDKLRSELEAIPNVTKVDFDKDLIYDTHELVVLVSWHSDSDTAQWFKDKTKVRNSSIEVFKNNGLKLSDPVEDNGSYFYFVLREITHPVDESLKEAWSTKDGFEEDETVWFSTGNEIDGQVCYHTLKRKHRIDNNTDYKVIAIDYGFRQEDPNEKPHKDEKSGMMIMPKTKVIYDKPKVLDVIDFTAQEYPEIEDAYYSASETSGDLNKYKELILDLFGKKGEAKENLKEELSQEEKSDYGLTTLINNLIKDELEAIDGYNSAIVTLATEGKEEFIDIIKDIISEENVHIGQLQTILGQLSSDSVVDIEKGQLEGQTQLENKPSDMSELKVESISGENTFNVQYTYDSYAYDDTTEDNTKFAGNFSDILTVKAKDKKEALEKADEYCKNNIDGYIENSCRIVDNSYSNSTKIESKRIKDVELDDSALQG